MDRTSPNATPQDRISLGPQARREDGAGSEPFAFAWETLVPRLVHPTKVAIVEAVAWIGQPLSAVDLREVFDERLDLSSISYHVVQLAKVGALVKVSERQVRGAVKKSYFFPSSE
jgi:hypothetical protein